MSKIKILQYCNKLDYDCTSRIVERYIKHINKERFEIYVIYNTFNDNNRLKNFQELLPADNIRGFYMSDNSLQFNTPRSHNFYDVLKGFNVGFDIFHIHRAGYPEFPLNTETKKYFKKVVETNMSGCDDIVFSPDLSLCVSKFVFDKKNIKSNCEILYNGVEENECKTTNLKTELSLSKRFVFGRIGCANNFHSIALEGFKKFNAQVFGNNAVYLIVNPCNFTREYVEQNRVPNVIFYDAINSDKQLYDFYKSIDVFAHYNLEGETSACFIQEAMISGKPIITHPTENKTNLEIINNFGFVAKDSDEYCGAMKLFYRNDELRNGMARNGQIYATRNFEIKKIIKKLEQYYINILK